SLNSFKYPISISIISATFFSAEKNVAEMIDMLMGYLKEFNEARGVNYTEAEARKELGEYLPTLKRWNGGS
ncbi:MAG: zinc ribbon domain-containing protein, partial [Firmicutes bacterium]|nr:zinc ribbon domain-containing protein [Bacillota bacterium]